MKKNKKGFTIIEIFLVVAIIAILVSIVLASIFSARVKSQKMSVFYSMRGTADVSFTCLGVQLPNVRLSSFDDLSHGSICIYNPGAGYVDAPGYSDWPDIKKSGWSTDLKTNLTQDGFFWCSVFSTGTSHPTNVGSYSDGTYGGAASSGNFCYMLKNGSSYIWCTQEGCRKEGF
jgi:prepilin-type N-terminal cleavage/methylation domain-containing protein